MQAREDLRPAWEDLHPVPGSLHVKRSSMPELRRGKGSSNLARDWEEWLQQARERQKGGRLEGREVEKRIEVEPETLEKKDEKSILEATPGTLERRAASGISGKEEKSLGEAVPGTLERKTVPGMEKEKALAEAAPGTLEQEETIVAEAVPDTLENEEVKEGEGDQERLEQQEQSVVEALPAAEKQDEIKKTQTFEEEVEDWNLSSLEIEVDHGSQKELHDPGPSSSSRSAPSRFAPQITLGFAHRWATHAIHPPSGAPGPQAVLGHPEPKAAPGSSGRSRRVVGRL